MDKNVRSKTEWLEWRRLQALRLSNEGWTQQDIASSLGVSKGAVSRWLAAAKQGSEEALLSRRHLGAAPKLTAEQQRLLPDFLSHGPEAYGFGGQEWTTGQIAKVIEEEFGVSYHPGNVSRLLKKLRGTSKTLAVSVSQQERKEIQRWRKEVWPELKRRASKERRTLVFPDETEFYLLPKVVKKLALTSKPKSHQEQLVRDHLSVIGALTRDAGVFALVRNESLTGDHTEEFLRHLIRHLGPRLFVVWDSSPVHRRSNVKDFFAGNEGRHVRVETLPPYAPDLNPVQGLWQRLKQRDLRKVVCLDLEDLRLQVDAAIVGLQRETNVIRSFFRKVGLPL